MTGSDFPAIEIYYYCTTGKDNLEITPIPFHRRYKAGGFYGGMGGRGSIDMNNDMNVRACIQTPNQTGYMRWGADDLSESIMHMNVRACIRIHNRTFYTRARQQRDLV